jgi:hypothetical protein
MTDPKELLSEQQPLQLSEVQKALQKADLDGWLFYDFHGQNPIAKTMLLNMALGIIGHGKH